MLFDTKPNNWPLNLLHSLVIMLSLTWALPAVGQMQVAGYDHRDISGWNVYVSQNAIATSSLRTQVALTLLETKLNDILALELNQEVKGQLQEVPIFVDWNTTTGAAVYHPSVDWLIQNGYPPEMAKSVEITNIQNFIAWTNQNQPMMVLHELAHAFHDKVLGYGDPEIFTAYNTAISTSIYNNVLYNNGSQAPFRVASAYATNNQIEYFAEITEAYFGTNDYYPFVRSELATHDPLGFAAVETSWQISSATAIEEVPEFSLSAPYPNPTEGLLNVSGKVEVFDVLGRRVLTGENSLDMRSLPAGLYSVRGVSNSWTVIKR